MPVSIKSVILKKAEKERSVTSVVVNVPTVGHSFVAEGRTQVFREIKTKYNV